MKTLRRKMPLHRVLILAVMLVAVSGSQILLAVGARQAHAAATLGETFDPTQGGICTPAGDTYIQTAPTQYAAPTAGVITSWSYQAAASPPAQLKLKVARAGDMDQFLIVGESAFQPLVANALNTFPTQITVLAGDVIGLTLGGDGECFRFRGEPFQYGYNEDDPATGTTAPFGSLGSGLQFDISAKLEPDCDNDGLGDETQDPDVPAACAPPPPPPDTDPPQTTLTKGAPKKTDSNKVKFKFSSDEAGSTFACKLDKGPFKPCTSPKTVKRLDEGKHQFRVRAVDAAGNVDLTAAADKFTVVE